MPFFQPIINFPKKYFGANSITNMTLKRFTKAVDIENCYQRESLRITFRTRTKTTDALPTLFTINTPQIQVPSISITRTKLLIAYQPT